MQRQTNAMAEINKHLQAQSGILSCLTGKSEDHGNRLNGVSDSLATLETRLLQISADSEAPVQGVHRIAPHRRHEDLCTPHPGPLP